MKYYVVSDPHGFFTIMRQSLEDAGFFHDMEPHKLILLGDLLDRGKEPFEMIRFVIDLMKQDQVILVRGNHEDLFMEMVTEDRGLPLSHHRSNGTYQTALDLTGMKWRDAISNPEELCERALSTPFVRTILPAMRNYYETKKFVFVHGWVPSIQNSDGTFTIIDNWRDAGDATWGLARWINGIQAAQSSNVPDKTVVCGHWHASFGHSRYEHKGSENGPDADFSPYYGPGVIAVDACTGISKQVNCIVLQDEGMGDMDELSSF